MSAGDTGPLIWLFDIDGTLIQSGGAGGVAMSAALRACFGVAPDTRRVRFAGRTDRAIAGDLLDCHNIPCTEQNIAQLYADYLERLPEAMEQCQGEVLPGVELWLERITLEQMPLGLLTGNMFAAAKIKLEYYGLWKYFSFGGYGDAHQQRERVASEAVDAAAKSLDITPTPSSVWVVGDTPHDIACAKACQLNSIAVGTGRHSREELLAHAPNLFLQSLHEVAPLVRIVINAGGYRS